MSLAQPSSDNSEPHYFGAMVEADTMSGGLDDHKASVDWHPILELIKRLPSYARLTAAMAKDKRVPTSAKSILAVAGAYLVSPIDFIPRLIPVAGQLDDLYVVLTGVQLAMRVTPQAVVDEHLVAAGLAANSVSKDLAALRLFVRQGIQWTFQRGVMVTAGVSRRAVWLVERVRTGRVNRNDS